MMRKIKVVPVLAVCCLLTGCFQVEGVHVLHDYGESDTGGYRITLNRLTYALLNGNGEYSTLLKKLETWSRPTTHFGDDSVYIEDTTGEASMEYFYDIHSCVPASISGLMDCHFAFNLPKDVGEMPNWSIDWEVVVQPDMTVLSSNQQRTLQEKGLDHLIWYFDGDRVSEASVDFTVRVPRAR